MFKLVSEFAFVASPAFLHRAMPLSIVFDDALLAPSAVPHSILRFPFPADGALARRRLDTFTASVLAFVKIGLRFFKATAHALALVSFVLPFTRQFAKAILALAPFVTKLDSRFVLLAFRTDARRRIEALPAGSLSTVKIMLWFQIAAAATFPIAFITQPRIGVPAILASCARCCGKRGLWFSVTAIPALLEHRNHVIEHLYQHVIINGTVSWDGKMETNESNRSSWRFVDGSLAVTVSMAVAVAINYCQSCAGLWGLGFLKGLTEKDDGVIILGTLLLFPTTVALYGVLKMWFAAKEAVEKKAAERGRRQERERIKRVLVSHGITPPPEIDSPPADGADANRPQR